MFRSLIFAKFANNVCKFLRLSHFEKIGGTGGTDRQTDRRTGCKRATSASVRDLRIYFDAELSMQCHVQKKVAN